MNVVYFAVGPEHAEMAEDAAEALRLTNPLAHAWVLTDEKTQFKTLEPVRGFTSPATLIYDRTLAQAHFLRRHRQALFLDSDCIVNQPLDGAFKGPIAVTQRKPPKEVPGQIYNGGVLYGEGSAGVAFWNHFADVYPALQRDAWAWYGDQVILSHMVPDYLSTKIYPGDTHNYVWKDTRELDAVLPAFIVHFKGAKRKPFIPRYLDTLRAAYGRAPGLLRSA